MQNRAIVQTIETADQAAQRRLFLRSKYAEHFPVGKREAAEVRRRADFLAREGVPDAAALADKIDELAKAKGGSANFLDVAEFLPDDPRAVRAFVRILGSLQVPEVTKAQGGVAARAAAAKSAGRNFGSQTTAADAQARKAALAELETAVENLVKDLRTYRESCEEAKTAESTEFAGEKSKAYGNYVRRKVMGRLVAESSAERADKLLATPSDAAEVPADGAPDWAFDAPPSADEPAAEPTSALSEGIGAHAERLRFFHKVFESAAKGYIFTFADWERIKKILDALDKGRVVTLLGHTGSGKTELARFICREFLDTRSASQKKDNPDRYVFIAGDRSLDSSDIVIDKAITSRSISDAGGVRLANDSDDSADRLKFAAQALAKDLQTSVDVHKIVRDDARFKGLNETDRASLESQLEKADFLKRHLTTEYHLMGILRAMKEGCPLIFDEANLVQKAVLMGLNDYLTRRPGNDVKLPNGLKPLKVKEGFKIILTGNDPDANRKRNQYGDRYGFDEAFLNRIRVFTKDYPVQEGKKFAKRGADGDVEVRDPLDYLRANEAYGLALMMMFDRGVRLPASNKFGFEVAKREFEGVGETAAKESVFKQLKSMMEAVAKVQRAFAGESYTSIDPENSSFAITEAIRRKVFSIRNLKDVLESYRKSDLPLEWHLWNEFIDPTSAQDEKFALLLVFRDHGFFKGDGILVRNGGTEAGKRESLASVSAAMEAVARGHGKRAAKFRVETVKSKVLLTKQDVMREYFGRGMELDDADLQGAKATAEFQETRRADGAQETAQAVSVQELVDLVMGLEDAIAENAPKIDSLYALAEMEMVVHELRSVLEAMAAAESGAPAKKAPKKAAAVQPGIDPKHFHDVRDALVTLANDLRSDEPFGGASTQEALRVLQLALGK